MRRRKDLTLERFGEAMDYTKSSINKLEKGRGWKRPQNFLSRLERAYGAGWREWVERGVGPPPVEKVEGEKVENEPGGLREGVVPYEMRRKDGQNRTEAEAFKWLFKNEDEVIAKLNEVLLDNKSPWPRRLERAELLLLELRRRVGHKGAT